MQYSVPYPNWAHLSVSDVQAALVAEGIDPDMASRIARGFVAAWTPAALQEETNYEYLNVGTLTGTTSFEEHDHDGATSLVVDHGNLTGLGDDDHPQYTTDAEATALAATEVSSHEAAGDPHAQYLTEAERAATDAASHTSGSSTDGQVLTSDGLGGAAWENPVTGVTDHGALTGLGDDDHTQYALADGTRGNFEVAGAVATHEAAGDPHAQYLTQAEGDAAYDAAGTAAAGDAAHVAAPDPHAQYLTTAEGDAAYAPIAKGVTNGDTHDHAGGDGAQIDHGGLAGLADDDHTQYSRADGTRAFTGEVSGITPTTDPALATKGYTDGLVESHFHDGTLAPILLFPQVGGVALVDDTASALSTPEQWGTGVVSFADASGLAVDIIAHLTGAVQYNQVAASRRQGRIYIEVSLDGGSTWNRSSSVLVEVHGNDTRSVGAGEQYFVSGSATGTVQVRALLEQVTLGTAGDVTFRDGYITATVVRSQP